MAVGGVIDGEEVGFEYQERRGGVEVEVALEGPRDALGLGVGQRVAAGLQLAGEARGEGAAGHGGNEPERDDGVAMAVDEATEGVQYGSH